jgi:hypothetical protein
VIIELLIMAQYSSVESEMIKKVKGVGGLL